MRSSPVSLEVQYSLEKPRRSKRQTNAFFAGFQMASAPQAGQENLLRATASGIGEGDKFGYSERRRSTFTRAMDSVILKIRRARARVMRQVEPIFFPFQ